MIAIMILPCIKCGKKGYKEWFLPVFPSKKTKKGMSFSLTPMVWLCKKHDKELNKWVGTLEVAHH